MKVWLPLYGPNKFGHNPKGVATSAWQHSWYKGIEPLSRDWVGLRLDDFVVVDCDDETAMEAWLKYIDLPLDHTWVRKTPHGWHFFYRRTYEVLDVRAHKPLYVSPKIDLKAGMGHQVVFYAPGYEDLTPFTSMAPFRREWYQEPERMEVAEEWSEMPDGMADTSLTAFAGTFRRFGMDRETITKCLAAINEITMTTDPMPMKSIRRIARSIGSKMPEEAKSVMCPKCSTEVETR